MPIPPETRAINLLIEAFPGSRLIKPGEEFYGIEKDEQRSVEEVLRDFQSTAPKPKKSRRGKGRGPHEGGLFT